MGTDTMRHRFGEVVTDLLDDDPRMAVVLADIGVGRLRQTGAIDRHPERIINVGIREQLMMGVAAGLALEGHRPIVHSYAPFLVERPFESLKLDLGHQGVGAVLVSTGGSYDAAAEGRTHQAPEDVALVSTLPGWEVHVPGHADELETLLRAAVTNSHPVYIRMSEQSNRSPVPVVPGRIHVVRKGERATVIAVGPMLDVAVEAIAGLDVTLLYATTVVPFDPAGLRREAAGGHVIVVEPYLQGTSAHAVQQALSDRAIRLLSLGVARTEHRHYGTGAQHAAAHGLDVAGVRASITGFLGNPCDATATESYSGLLV